MKPMTEEKILRVPFVGHRPAGGELAALQEVVRSRHPEGDGAFTRKVERWLEAWSGAPRVLLTDSADSALEIALAAAGIGPGDEVLTPAFNYMSAANACLNRGALPVFTDVEPEALNLNPHDVEDLVSPRTRAIVPACYGGQPCDLEALTSLCRRHRLLLIEDASLGFGARYRERPLGTWGQLGIWCFHAKRHITGGEAGALVINDPQLVEVAEQLRERGTNRQQLLRGEADAYRWQRPGRSCLASDLAAAYLWAQLQALDSTLERLRGQCALYRQALEPCQQKGWLKLPLTPAEAVGNGVLFYFLLPDGPTRNSLIRHLRDAGVISGSHYSPLHLEPAGRALGAPQVALPTAESAAQRLIRLPVHTELKSAQQEWVIEQTLRFFQRR